MKHLMMAAACLALTALPAHALDQGTASDQDPRVRYYTYHPEEIFALSGYYGFVTSIFLREDEKVDTVSAGDAKGWDIQISKSRDFIFIKPVAKPPVPSNMTVVTNRRTYTFSLTPREVQGGALPSDLAFKVRFTYSEPPAAPEVETVYLPADTSAADDAAARAAAAAAAEEERRQQYLQRLSAPSVIFDETEKEESEGEDITPGRDFSDEYRGRIEGVRSPDQLFLDDQSSLGVPEATAVRIADLDKKVLQGTLIPGVLETAVNSELSGMVRATVAEDVWSHDNTRILIPRGARLIGSYRNAIPIGQSRVLIAWTRMVTGDGVSVQLGSPGTDQLGRAGVTGHVDTHFMERFGSAALVSIITGGTVVAVGQLDDDASEDTGSELATSLTDNFGGLLAPYLNIPATVNVNQGARIIVFTARDLDFGVAYRDEV